MSEPVVSRLDMYRATSTSVLFSSGNYEEDLEELTQIG